METSLYGALVVLLSIVGMTVVSWSSQTLAGRYAERADDRLSDALERERRTLERLLDLQARTGAPMLTDAEASFALAGQDDEEESEPRIRSADELMWLGQWEDGNARTRWASWIDNRVAEGRTPEQALADAELYLVTKDQPISPTAAPVGRPPAGGFAETD